MNNKKLNIFIFLLVPIFLFGSLPFGLIVSQYKQSRNQEFIFKINSITPIPAPHHKYTDVVIENGGIDIDYTLIPGQIWIDNHPHGPGYYNMSEKQARGSFIWHDWQYEITYFEGENWFKAGYNQHLIFDYWFFYKHSFIMDGWLYDFSLSMIIETPGTKWHSELDRKDFYYNSYVEPIIDIKNVTNTENDISINYDFFYGLPIGYEWESTNFDDEHLMIEVYNKTTNQKDTKEIKTYQQDFDTKNRPGGNHTIYIGESSFDEISFNPGNEFEITFFVSNTYEEDNDVYLDPLLIKLKENYNPSMSINSLTSSDSDIMMDYSYKQGGPIGNEKGYVDITNETTGKTETLLLNPGENEKIIFDSMTLPNMSFNPRDKFKIKLYTVGGTEGDVSGLEQTINLKANPIVSIDELKSTTNGIEVTYRYSEGSPIDNEKGYLEIWNTTTNQKEIINISPGNNKILIDNTSLNIDFNEGDKFEITIYTENASNKNDKDVGNVQLLTSPKLAIEANYDNINNPQNLTIKTYYKEQNDADGMNLNIVVYDKQGNAIDNFIVDENQEIVIDLTNYENVSWINVNYVWTNNQQGYESIPSIIFDEYIGNAFELINNPPYELN